jgi:hypothetical protein
MAQRRSKNRKYEKRDKILPSIKPGLIKRIHSAAGYDLENIYKNDILPSLSWPEHQRFNYGLRALVKKRMKLTNITLSTVIRKYAKGNEVAYMLEHVLKLRH